MFMSCSRGFPLVLVQKMNVVKHVFWDGDAWYQYSLSVLCFVLTNSHKWLGYHSCNLAGHEAEWKLLAIRCLLAQDLRVCFCMGQLCMLKCWGKAILQSKRKLCKKKNKTSVLNMVEMGIADNCIKGAPFILTITTTVESYYAQVHSKFLFFENRIHCC